MCETAGLILRRDSGGWYDRFRGRLMFPICDEQGRVIAFSGRVLQGDEKQAKYVNSPETPIFSKGRVLFALDKAKRSILDAGKAILAEGQLDTIACHAAGIRNVVAPQGTAFTADQARVLKRYVDEVVLCFDGDKAGRDAVIRALIRSWRPGWPFAWPAFRLRMIRIPGSGPTGQNPFKPSLTVPRAYSTSICRVCVPETTSPLIVVAWSCCGRWARPCTRRPTPC